MTLRGVLSIIEGKLISEQADLNLKVRMGCGVDLMSDVLASTHEGTLLMTGLLTPGGENGGDGWYSGYRFCATGIDGGVGTSLEAIVYVNTDSALR